ncbi:Hypothetical predicted protein, partial [Scomber scombrus]
MKQPQQSVNLICVTVRGVLDDVHALTGRGRGFIAVEKYYQHCPPPLVCGGKEEYFCVTHCYRVVSITADHQSEWVTGVRSKYSGRNSSSVFRELRDKNESEKTRR